MYLRAEEGEYYLDYEGDPNAVCAAMFMAPSNMRIQMRLTLDVPCSTAGIVTVRKTIHLMKSQGT